MLKNMKLGLKLGLGFGLVLLLTVIVGINGYSGGAEMTARMEIMEGLNEMAKDLMEGRVHAWTYANTGDENAVHKQQELFNKLFTVATETSEKMVDKKDKARVIAFADAVKDYGEATVQYMEIERQKDQAAQGLTESGDAALAGTEKYLEQAKKRYVELLKSGTASNEELVGELKDLEEVISGNKIFDEIRLDVLYYITFVDMAYVKSFEEKLSEMLGLIHEDEGQIVDQSIHANLLNIKSSLNDYHEKFKSYVDCTQRHSTLVKRMAGLAEKTDVQCLAVTTDEKRETIQKFEESTFLIIGTTAVALVLGLVAAFFLTRAITGPIRKGVEFAGAMAQGDFTRNLEVDQKDEMGALSAALNNMVFKLQGVVANVGNATENIASGSEELSASAESMSQGAVEQAASIEEVSSSMDQMASNIKQNAENAKQTDMLANKAASDARESGEAVTQTVEAMNSIAEKISIIEDIARQTNLLALNAAIEAARAGRARQGICRCCS